MNIKPTHRNLTVSLILFSPICLWSTMQARDEPPLPSSTTGSPQQVPSPQPFTRTDFGDKAKELLEPAFGPRAFLTTAFIAGIRMASVPSQYPHEWRSGGQAFGRIYGDTYAHNGAEALGRLTASVIFREDPRYRRSQSTSPIKRLSHALAFTVVDRTDGGRPAIALSNFAGAAAGGFIGNAYLPAGYSNPTHAGQRAIAGFSEIAAQNVLEEFAPEIGHLIKKLHLPHVPLPPVWWSGNK